MFTGNVMLLPGQELREFTVQRPQTHETQRGRETINGYETLGTLRAILAQAKPEEIQRWRQLNHPVTHKIITQHKPDFEVKPGDIFEHNGRRFYTQTLPYDPGDLSHWTIFYCDERTDVV